MAAARRRGKPKPLETRVFSNELGEPIVLKTHGHAPTWNPRLNYPPKKPDRRNGELVR